MEKIKLMLPDGRYICVGDRVNDGTVFSFHHDCVFYTKDFESKIIKLSDLSEIKTIQHVHEWTNALGQEEKAFDGDEIYTVIEGLIIPLCILSSKKEIEYNLIFTCKESAQKYLDSLNEPAWMKVKPENCNIVYKFIGDGFYISHAKSSNAYQMLLIAMNKINEGVGFGHFKYGIYKSISGKILASSSDGDSYDFEFPDAERRDYFLQTFESQLKDFYMINIV